MREILVLKSYTLTRKLQACLSKQLSRLFQVCHLSLPLVFTLEIIIKKKPSHGLTKSLLSPPPPSMTPSCRTSLTRNPSAGGFRWRKVKLLTVWSRCFHKWQRVALHYGRPLTLSMSRLLRLALLVPVLSPSVCLSSLPKVCDVAVIPKEAQGWRLIERLRVIMLWSVKKVKLSLNDAAYIDFFGGGTGWLDC